MSGEDISMTPSSPRSTTKAREDGFVVDLSIKYDTTDIAKAIVLPPSEQWQNWFKTWLLHLQPTYSPIQSYELSLLLTTDATIQTLNLQYRQLDTPTNVLTFAMLDGDAPPPEVLALLPVELGDIVISVETAQRQAHEHGHNLDCELAWLATHGLLHLLEWEHPNEEDLQRMLVQQTTLLRAVGFAISNQFYYAAQTY